MQELIELKEVIQILTAELKTFSDLLKEKNLRDGKLGGYNEDKVLEELKEKGTLSKTEIVRILGVSANSAQNIMKRISGKDKEAIYIKGCGSKSSKLISSEDPLVKKAEELLKLIPLNHSLSEKEIIEKLKIGKDDGFRFELWEVLRTAGMLGSEFKWVEEVRSSWIDGEIKRRMLQRVE